MAKFMASYSGETYAVLRIMAGLLFLCHGMQKLFAFPAEMSANVPDFVVYVAGPIELVGGALIAVGFLTRWAAFVCSGTMAAAYWMAHGLENFWPVLNHGELAILYCFVFLYISANGGGKWSVDGAKVV
jgi:putative oxidoreductase